MNSTSLPAFPSFFSYIDEPTLLSLCDKSAAWKEVQLHRHQNIGFSNVHPHHYFPNQISAEYGNKTQESMVSVWTKALFGILPFTTYGLTFFLFYQVSFALAKWGQWMHKNIHIFSLLFMHKIYLWPHKLLIIKNNDFFMRERKPLILKISRTSMRHIKLQNLYTDVVI